MEDEDQEYQVEVMEEYGRTVEITIGMKVKVKNLSR